MHKKFQTSLSPLAYPELSATLVRLAVVLVAYDIVTFLGLSQQNLLLLVGQVVGRIDVAVHLEIS